MKLITDIVRYEINSYKTGCAEVAIVGHKTTDDNGSDGTKGVNTIDEETIDSALFLIVYFCIKIML